MFGFGRKGLPQHGEEIVASNVAHWQRLGTGERERLLDLTDWLLARKHWEAAAGFELDDEIEVVIASQAALLILGLTRDHYRHVSAVIVYPSTMVHRGERAGPVPGTRTDAAVPLHGLAQGRSGPVLIAWDQAARAARHPGRGHNVVFHEFAHKLDMLDGHVDGMPPLGRDAAARWERIAGKVFADLRAGRPRPPLRSYGGADLGELFAVATEAFFDRPDELAAEEADLYAILAAFYRQDPAARLAGR